MPPKPFSSSPIPTAKVKARRSPFYQAAFGLDSLMGRQAKRLGVSPQTLANWLSGLHAIPEPKKAAVFDLLTKQEIAIAKVKQFIFTKREAPLCRGIAARKARFEGPLSTNL